jgi:polyhydroxybutyrate depolymerase
MTRRTVVIAAVLCCLGLPPLLVLLDAASHYSANRTTASIVSSGEKRDYILYVPRSYDRAKPAPLVISMHGAENWPSFQMNVSQWNRVADEHGFIVVYPAGEGGGPRIWRMRGSRTPSRMPDVIFISDLIDTLSSSYNIDPARIYANGLSNGGGMSFVLSCTLSNRIAAIGAVAAAETLPWEWCPDTTPVPMVAFHGTADRFTPYDGAKVWLAPEPFPSIPEWTAKWAQRNRCAPMPVESPVAADVMRREYIGCADNAGVVLYTIRGGGHTWPGGTPMPEWLVGRTTRSIDATQVMWAFFRDHPRREK